MLFTSLRALNLWWQAWAWRRSHENSLAQRGQAIRQREVSSCGGADPTSDVQQVGHASSDSRTGAPRQWRNGRARETKAQSLARGWRVNFPDLSQLGSAMPLSRDIDCSEVDCLVASNRGRKHKTRYSV